MNCVQRNDHEKKEKVTMIIDQIKEEDVSEEIEDAQFFELRSNKLAKPVCLIEAKDKMILLVKYQEDTIILKIKEALKY